jgi:hypothetical protein
MDKSLRMLLIEEFMRYNKTFPSVNLTTTNLIRNRLKSKQCFEVTACDQHPDPRQGPFWKYTWDCEKGIVGWNGRIGDQDKEELRVTLRYGGSLLFS